MGRLKTISFWRSLRRSERSAVLLGLAFAAVLILAGGLWTRAPFLILGGALVIMAFFWGQRPRGAAALPVFLYLLGTGTIFLFVSRGAWQVAAAGFFGGGLTALIARGIFPREYPTWSTIFASIIFFYISAATAGLSFHLYMPLTAVLLLNTAAAAALAWHVFTATVPVIKDRLVVAGILALIAGEVTWVLAFWPVSYMVSGGVLFVFFYLLLSVLQSITAGTATRASLRTSVLVAATALFLVLVTARWTV